MELEQWKQKYYDQLDRLEKKEQDWQNLETTLKRAISRLSLAAEGQHQSLDKPIIDLRQAIKNNINTLQLDSIVDELSKKLSLIEENENAPKRESIYTLEKLIKQLNFPESAKKSQKKLVIKFNQSDDSERDSLLKDTLKLLISVIDNNAEKEAKTGFIDKLFNSNKSSIEQPQINTHIDNTGEVLEDQHLEIYKKCFIDILNKFDDKHLPNGQLAALKINIRNTSEKIELDELSNQLLSILLEQKKQSLENSNNIIDSKPYIDDNLQPTIQELLIRLFEQLIVPTDLHADVENMKQQLEKETNPTNWKQLLKDVTALINSIRSRMQKEKHEFEDFLQQVTERLKSMDNFLQNETINLQHAISQGSKFDQQLELNVEEIRLDITQATELTDLKICVTSKLDTITDHIQLYRDFEKNRFEQSQEEVSQMHSKMQSLEFETEQLKKIIIQTNKEAMHDALTEIPNRLSFDKKIIEEINRWKRFSNPLSLAIWDIDLFKKVNDTYGHKAGDKVLKTVAQLLVSNIRSTDFLARYGGEEFVMLLPGTEQDEAMQLLNKLREKVAGCSFRYHGNAVKISISCGLSSFNNDDTLEQVFERADKALYQAKENGRNQCVILS